MSEVKWIKISTNIFDDEKIKLIETLPDSDTLIIIWFKLLSMAGRCNDSGMIYLTRDVPYNEEMLSTIMRRPVNTVRLAMSEFNKLGMIDIVDNFISVINWEKHQNVEAMARLKIDNLNRKQNQRNRKYLIEQKYFGLNSDGTGKCAYCGENDILTLDHIIPISKGGLDVFENFELICNKCNASKNNRDISDYLNELLALNKLNIQSIVNNKKIMSFVEYKNKTFKQKNTEMVVTVTTCHDTDKIRLDKTRLDKTRLDKKREGRFTPPSPDEVQSYLDELNETRFSGLHFHDWYESKGWMIGKNKMKSWKSAVRTWIERENERGPRPQKLDTPEARAARAEEIKRIIGE